jgi:hypothetical protein
MKTVSACPWRHGNIYTYTNTTENYYIRLFLFSQVFPGTFSLEPMVNPTTQASGF